MKVVALVSGGKDSCYAMMKCIQYGHEIVALANLMPADDSVDELDSYMYQTVGHQIVVGYAECMGLPLFRRRIHGSTRHHKLDYKNTPGDEVEDMFILLSELKRHIPSITAVSSGAIASDYQRLRVENVCSRLGLVSLAYLWKQDQSCLLQEMISNEITAITVKIAAMGLDPVKHLGKEIAFLNPYLHKLKDLYGINVCGEGGEYETLTLDCPLFINARIVLDEYEVVMHSPDSIAPVAVLHPLAFHLETKVHSQSSECGNIIQESNTKKLGSIVEVQGDCLENSESKCKPATDIAGVDHSSADGKLHISRTKNNDTFSLCCWLQDSSGDLQEDLKTVLWKIECQLTDVGFGWENVLYIHLYIDDMDKFSIANETYVQFVTQEKCPFGVPSRSTVELPLLTVGLGSAYVEVLATSHQSKRVLHVQSISCWAPSCIGPYSQATLHKGALYMAGQLGLDPPTMTLCNGPVSIELEQALKNSEAVANCFNCSISTSALALIFYCSSSVVLEEMMEIHEKQSATLNQMRLQLGEEAISKSLDPVFLYILVPELPKKAHVEVKPILYVEDCTEAANTPFQQISLAKASHRWGFEHAEWHDYCIQKCVVPGKICIVILSCSSEMAAKICADSLSPHQNNNVQSSLAKTNIGRISKFCIYLLDKVLMENSFSWDDSVSLRFYVPKRLEIPLETLMLTFSNAFSEHAEISEKTPSRQPIFNIIPVLGAGSSSIFMEDIITCEVLAQKS